MRKIEAVIEYLTQLISDGGIVVGFLIVMFESFIPMLPLCVFIALNISAFGVLLGTLISWIATSFGCYVSYLIFYYLSNDFIYKRINKKTKKRIDKALTKFKKLSLSELTILVTLPFTPAFLVNIVAGVAGYGRKKFLAGILIGKLFMVVFWGYIGKSFIESITDVKAIIFILFMILLAYIISKIVSKRVNLE